MNLNDNVHSCYKGKIIVSSYYFISSLRKLSKKHSILKFIYFPFLFLYRFFIDFFLKCELPPSCIVGKNLIIHHGHGIVINNSVLLGDNVIIRHHTTIGNKIINGIDLGAPKIGNNVDIGAHSIIIGPITIGDNIVIGAGSVVISNLKSNSVYAGNPAKFIKKIIV
ncbi:serine acetyltransferase [Photobacterium carnosum]|uniref:serine acetyltransferase n=1 Tax=Photobacterium carnosum TaxID=2023717 RepID=UPI001E376EDF|nr:DapH/DapD/GlmU-related protein [Photobacterium carnosum]MCD9497750.1 serine acetyltransferase [Photobacterium carnosum]